MAERKVHEKFLYEIWKNQNFIKNLTTKNGDQIKIIDTGSENKELGGPDFRNARIKIGNITYLGDVEIDSFQKDWKAHGHFFNKRYNKVILHIFCESDRNKPFVYTQDGRKVQSISLENFLAKDLKSALQKAIASERQNRNYNMPCSESSGFVDEKVKLDFIYELGIKRFKIKCRNLISRLKEISYLKELNLKEPIVRYELDEKFYKKEYAAKDFDNHIIWQQLFYESVFEALGYSKNKDILRKLAVSLNIDFFDQFRTKENFFQIIESSLFNVSGLIPCDYNLPDEETSEYVKFLVERWSELKLKYDGRTFNLEQWHFFKLRPQNFPTIRIAGGAIILFRILNQNMVGNIIAKVERINDPQKLMSTLRNNIIVKAEGFWKNHYVFNQPAKKEIKYFVGLSRADEIIINIILPFLAIYFEIFGKENQKQKIIKLYSEYCQESKNHLVMEVASTLKIDDAWKRSILYQGILDLYRNYCAHNKCLKCPVGVKIFS
jgi:Protein of unknown function (DUF2851)